MEILAEQYIIDTNGKKVSVILSYKKYKKLLEDLHDLATIAERRNEKPISLEEIKDKLKKDGIL
ncbi:MAG: type II toxin-antitoxin system Phd/YefM family antitoxin [Acidobacteria bacterium]|nr:type II toxin-antitoxin system Phd/YefM family antitoxin [Acidobacteriota bacterium]